MRESPETLVIPYVQYDAGAAGERHQIVDLELCDNCKWSCTCITTTGIVDACPLCGNSISHIPLMAEEVCRIENDEKQGLVLEFSRKALLE
jgi:hypothetical protein